MCHNIKHIFVLMAEKIVRLEINQILFIEKNATMCSFNTNAKKYLNRDLV